MIPINYEERTTKEVLTNAMIQGDSDDQKKFFVNQKLLMSCGHNGQNHIGYQYCSSYKRHFPLLYKKCIGTRPTKFRIKETISLETKPLDEEILDTPQYEPKPDTCRSMTNDASTTRSSKKAVRMEPQEPLKKELTYTKFEQNT